MAVLQDCASPENVSPSFREVLAKDLKDLQLYEGAFLQYVDDILIASETKALLEPWKPGSSTYDLSGPDQVPWPPHSCISASVKCKHISPQGVVTGFSESHTYKKHPNSAGA